MAANNGKPVWFVTGCSTGFGRELVRQLLDAGYPTVVSARDRPASPTKSAMATGMRLAPEPEISIVNWACAGDRKKASAELAIKLILRNESEGLNIGRKLPKNNPELYPLGREVSVTKSNPGNSQF